MEKHGRLLDVGAVASTGILDTFNVQVRRFDVAVVYLQVVFSLQCLTNFIRCWHRYIYLDLTFIMLHCRWCRCIIILWCDR